jgi:hypothetical protein
MTLGAPAEIDLDSRDKLPIIAVIKCTVERLSQVSRRSTLVLVAVREEDGAVFAGPAILPEPGVRVYPDWYQKGPPKRLSGWTPDSISTDMEQIDARYALNLPWEAATYRLTLVAWDWTSNTVRVRLKGKTSFAPGQRQPDMPGKKRTLPVFHAHRG